MPVIGKLAYGITGTINLKEAVISIASAAPGYAKD